MVKIERRKKECCIYCGGENLRFWDNGKINIICLICGKDFEAKREEDKSKFHETEETFNA